MKHFISEKNSEDIFVLLHGTGGNEFSLMFLSGQLNPKASILGFLGDFGVGEERRYFSRPVNQQLDHDDFNAAVDRFLLAWDNLALDYANVTFIGYSNGANLLQGILQKRPDISNRAILLHPQEFQLEFADKIKTDNQLLITTGANDTMVIPGDILTLSNRLKAAFTSVELVITDGQHGVTDDEMLKIEEWFANSSIS